MATTEQAVRMDTSDVDRHIGQALGGGQLKEPVTATDIRRWVQGMQYPNPIHYDDDSAATSPFGRLVAPQSFAVCADVGHGATPAIVGNIPGTHMIFGGDEWWFFGPRIFPGDRLCQERRFVDYKIADTKFAGPTMFSRGDTVHRNQRNEVIAIQRSTAVRYLADEARKRGFFSQTAPVPTWSAERLAEIRSQRLNWVRTLRQPSRTFEATTEGEVLPTRPIGPHTVQTFTTEWRAFIFQAWGSEVREGHDHIPEAGWLTEMDRKIDDDAQLDPGLADGLYAGPSRGHVDIKHALLIGMPRQYGYGAAMGAWLLDYVSGWAGSDGFIRHSNMQYRFPPFEGDLALVDGRVINKRFDATFDAALVTLEVVMTNQDGTVMAKGPVEVQLPA